MWFDMRNTIKSAWCKSVEVNEIKSVKGTCY